MVTLYYYASLKNCLVLGTGNKVEDFGVGFYTKYGDGGVDVSPIADLMKSEVRELGKYMGVSKEIVEAKPTDGLWDDGRGDEDQLGASYDDLEWAMEWIANNPRGFAFTPEEFDALPKRQANAVSVYKKRHFANRHKMNPIPVCDISLLRK
jgi:NAD+ synthase